MAIAYGRMPILILSFRRLRFSAEHKHNNQQHICNLYSLQACLIF